MILVKRTRREKNMGYTPNFWAGAVVILCIWGGIELYKNFAKNGKERQEKETKLLKTMTVDQIINYLDLWRGW